MPARSARRMNRLNHRPQNYRPPTEHLESRVLLTSATDAAIEQFNLSPALFVENDGQWWRPSV
ncbi:MAG TPA: hypothetical protein PK402_07690, partial [Tepidisphaeraceae bacterium]|nr:hypothetical protein [Tepidisphaeraceae bacterium]